MRNTNHMTKILGDNIQTNIQKNYGNDTQSAETFPWRQPRVQRWRLAFSEIITWLLMSGADLLDNIWNRDSRYTLQKLDII